ncbi:amino acid adenylation domain-containing protein [Streptomyces sp. MNP-20]|uniref:amino acid adenylation domain-containing protein n=1 Tax=Streptomyces sp. MNP-20 TaxID=2721165 RepID=UPI0015524078|nr:amino acid adenylation domain-containing protein [Streptomyces sp. MNP-20]
MTITGAPQRLIPRWAPPASARPGHAELSRAVPVRLAARVRLMARRSAAMWEAASGEAASGPAAAREVAPWEAAALAAHTAVLGALSGEQAFVTGYVPPAPAPDSGAAPADVRPCTLTLADESWRALLGTAARAAETTVDGAFETVLDLGPGQPYGNPDTALTVALRSGPEGPALRLRYRTDVLDAEAAERVAGYYVTAWEHMAAAPDAPCRSRGLLSEDELHRQLSGMAGPARALPDRRFHELLEEQVALRPDEIAAVHGSDSHTYAELNAKANRIAHALLARELGPEAVVAVVTERHLDWQAAVIGIFKAGAAYLPVEPGLPAERMARMLERSGCRLALTEEGGSGQLAQAAPAGLDVLTVTAAVAEGRSAHNPGVPVAPGQLAYLYFTSGSTGEPKGAMCEHEGFVNHLYAKIDDLGIEEGQVVAQTAPQSFDISLWQLVAALVVGGRTLIVEQEAILDVDRFLETVERGQVTVLQIVPSYLEVLLSRLEDAPGRLSRLRCVSVTGEALKKELTVRWFARFPDIALVNAYGLTETSDDTNHAVLTAVPERDSVPLGPPVRNVTIYVVDDDLRPVPLGAPGEIVFSGVCVGRGYVNDPERTEQAFGADPHRPGQRLYRSGDFGRWLPDGSLEFLGRRDAQIKIRGFRIEIGEIENQLLRLPGVRDGAVVVVDNTEGGRELIGFQTGSELPSDTLLDGLAQSLPVYMVPRRVVPLDALPLTPNGKTDKRALRALAQELLAGAEQEAQDGPRTAEERRMAEAWAEVLRVPVERIGRESDFFALGGTSLSAIRLIVKTERAFTLRDVRDHPTLAGLAALLGSASASPSPTTAAGEPGGGATPSPAQDDHRDEGSEHTMASTSTPAADAPFDVVRTEGRPAVLDLGPDVPSDPAAWAAEHRARLHATVAEHGALLVRGLGLRDAESVGRVSRELLHEVMTEREGFATRSVLADGVYSSSEWPAEQPMCMHHELSYAREVPGTLVFACLTAPASGGVTAVADSHEVLETLPAGLVERFEREGWLLDRTYTDLTGISLAAAFGTGDRAAVDAYCAARGIETRWADDGGLRTRQRSAALLRHPVSGRRAWFNQVSFLSEWTLDAAIREYLKFEFGDDGLPFNTRYGSGAAIDEATVLAINEAYEKHTLREPWRAGDLLVVDNLRMAHSREPYEGAREVAVVLGDPVALPPFPGPAQP